MESPKLAMKPAGMPIEPARMTRLCATLLSCVALSCAVPSDDAPVRSDDAPVRSSGGAASPSAPLRFAVAKFQHETCTFCPGGDTRIEDWLRQSEPLSGEALLSSGSYVRGFADRSREFGDVELVPLSSPDGVFGGSSRSWNTRETFDHFLDAMLTELADQPPVAAVYLALHGAMAVRDVPRPEAEIARRFREAVGPDVPIAATFDLHGNEDH